METRIQNLPPTRNGYLEVFGVGNFEIKLLYSTASDRYLYLQDWTGATSGCNVDIGSRTDITLRAQKAVNGSETLRVWDSTGTELTNLLVSESGPALTISVDLPGLISRLGVRPIAESMCSKGTWRISGCSPLRLRCSVGQPTDTNSTGDLLDYEFENDLNDSSGKGQTLTSLPSGANLTYR